MDRRKFGKISLMTGGGLLFQFHITGCKEESIQDVAHAFNAYLSIHTNGKITIAVPVPEIGQGVRRALPMLIIEELEARWEDVVLIQADAGSMYEGRNQRAAGSNSIKVFWEPLRRAGATALTQLKRVAAAEWELEVEDCYGQQGKIRNRKNRKWKSYGQLASKAAVLEPPEVIHLKDPSQFNILGKSVQNKDSKDLISGKIKFGSDIRLPGMVYASIERCPTYGGRIVSFDATKALAVSGIQKIFKVPSYGGTPDRPFVREGVAVVGDSVWSVLKARKLLIVEWDIGSNMDESTARLHQLCESAIGVVGEDVVKSTGNISSAMRRADTIVDKTFMIPMIAHIPMETINCTIHLWEDRVEIWSTSQMPFIEQQFLSDFLELPVEKVKIHIPRIGGGFGRRLSTDFTIEAVHVAREVDQPVHLFWTREDDLIHDSYRPFSYHRLISGLDKNGQIISWLHRQAGTSRYAFRSNRSPGESEFFPNHFPANLVDHFRLEYTLIESNIPRSLIRAPGNNALAFAVESFMDELAIESDKDPLAFRLSLLGIDRDFLFDEEDNTVINTGRMKAVLRKAASEADWGKSFEGLRGQGIAGYFTFDTYVAHVAEVSVDTQSGSLTIHKFVTSVDCGMVADRDGVIAQVEGAIHDGLSACLFQEITIENGAPRQTNFHNYSVLRMPESPQEIDVHIIESGFPPTGMGEPPYPPVQPAICNAIYAACGIRIRKLPIGDQLKLVR